VHKGNHNLWGRLEVLQRTPGELDLTGVADATRPRWIGALTVGYTHTLVKGENTDLGLGGAFTQDWLPSAYRGAYRGNPFSGKIFLQLGGMKMWEL
jgi:hypothetical protein